MNILTTILGISWWLGGGGSIVSYYKGYKVIRVPLAYQRGQKLLQIENTELTLNQGMYNVHCTYGKLHSEIASVLMTL